MSITSKTGFFKDKTVWKTEVGYFSNKTIVLKKEQFFYLDLNSKSFIMFYCCFCCVVEPFSSLFFAFLSPEKTKTVGQLHCLRSGTRKLWSGCLI